MSLDKPAKSTGDLEDNSSMFLRDQSPYEEKESETAEAKDVKPTPEASDVAEAVAAAVAAIQTSNKDDQDTSNLSTTRLWPIDKMVNDEEFSLLPASLRTSLAESADLVNGLIYIKTIEPKTFDNSTSASKYIQTFSENEGFTVNTQKEGDKMVFTCDHDKVYTHKRKYPDDEVATTHPDTPYEQCPFRVNVLLDGQMEISCGEHNHGPYGPAASAKKRRYTYFQTLLQLDSPAGTPIEDDKSPAKSQETDGITENHLLKGLVGALRFDNALLEEQLDEFDNVSHLFWTTSDCVEMLQQFPEVLFINFTKSPKVPTLVHIVGMTAFNTTFEVGYALLNNTGLADFRWVLYCVKNIVSKYIGKQYWPSAVITLREPMLMTAIDNVFENTNQICVTHLMREMNQKSADTFGLTEERETFMKRFRELVDSETPDIYAYNESDFQKKYAKTKILEYVKYNWLAYKTKFVRGWVDQHLNFNNYSMGKAELAQATVKKIADESGGDLLKIYYQIKDLLRREKIAYEELMASETQRCPVKFFVPFYDDVRFKVSTHALEMIKEQHELYLEAVAVGEPLHRCTGMFMTTTGLPCKHILSRPVTMEDLNPHWWLSKNKTVKQSLSESDRLGNELTNKFDQTMALVKEHFLNYASLESREFMLAHMVKYFSKAGIASIDSHLQGLTSFIPRAVTPVESRGTSPAGRVPMSPVSALPPQLIPSSTSGAETSSVASLEGSPVPLTLGRKETGGDLEVGHPEFRYHGEGSEEEGNEERKKHASKPSGDLLQLPGILPGTTTRRCGKCNQVGHNSRTCGQRLSLQGA